MKLIKVILIILIAAVALNFIKTGQQFHIAKLLPFADRDFNVDIYDYAGLAAIAIFVWGLLRLNRKDDEDE